MAKKRKKLKDGWDEAELRVERFAGPHGDFLTRRGLLDPAKVAKEREIVKRLRRREQLGDRIPRRKPKSPLHPVGLRRRVYERDGFQCIVCGLDDLAVLTLDHWVPQSRGGDGSFENLRTMCESCNNAKGNRMPGVDFDLSVARDAQRGAGLGAVGDHTPATTPPRSALAVA